jgi:hypothetical protein
MMADQARSRTATDILLTVLRDRKSRCPGKMVDVPTHIVPCPHLWGDTTFEKIGIKPQGCSHTASSIGHCDLERVLRNLYPRPS